MSGAFDVPIDLASLDDARKGGRNGQETIYRTFQRAVYTLARRMTRDPDTAHDVTQNTFMHAFRAMHQYRGEAAFGHWLRSIAATESLMHLRQGRRLMELFVPAEDYVEEIVGLEDVSTIDLERALELLPPMPRSVLWLYHVEGYTHPEIAQMCKKTVSFSKSQLSRAHQKLRQVLGIPAPETADADVVAGDKPTVLERRVVPMPARAMESMP